MVAQIDTVCAIIHEVRKEQISISRTESRGNRKVDTIKNYYTTHTSWKELATYNDACIALF